MPRIRTDNGAPIAGTGLLGRSNLSLGWLKPGIVQELIQAGRPQQNGRHERMHRTVKEDTTVPPPASRRAKRSRFNDSRYRSNNERPYEELNNSEDISLHKTRLFISEEFYFEDLRLESVTRGSYRVIFRDLEIGELNAEELRQ